METAKLRRQNSGRKPCADDTDGDSDGSLDDKIYCSNSMEHFHTVVDSGRQRQDNHARGFSSDLAIEYGYTSNPTGKKKPKGRRRSSYNETSKSQTAFK